MTSESTKIEVRTSSSNIFSSFNLLDRLSYTCLDILGADGFLQFTLLPVVVTLSGFNCPSRHLRINVIFGDMAVFEMSSKY